MHNDKLVYKVAIWVFFGISLWKGKEALIVFKLIFKTGLVTWYP